MSFYYLNLDEEEVSSESDISIRFSSDSSISSDGSYLSDDIESDTENNNFIPKPLNQKMNDTQIITQQQVKLDSHIFPSPSKKTIPLTPNSKKSFLTTTPTKSFPITPPKSNIKKNYRRRISLLNV